MIEKNRAVCMNAARWLEAACKLLGAVQLHKAGKGIDSNKKAKEKAKEKQPERWRNTETKCHDTSLSLSKARHAVTRSL